MYVYILYEGYIKTMKDESFLLLFFFFWKIKCSSRRKKKKYYKFESAFGKIRRKIFHVYRIMAPLFKNNSSSFKLSSWIFFLLTLRVLFFSLCHSGYKQTRKNSINDKRIHIYVEWTCTSRAFEPFFVIHSNKKFTQENNSSMDVTEKGFQMCEITQIFVNGKCIHRCI